MTAPKDGSMVLTVEFCYCLTGSSGGSVRHFVQSVSRTPSYIYTKVCVLYEHR